MTTLAELLVKVGVEDELDSGMKDIARSADRGFGKVADEADKAGMSIDKAGDRAEKAFSGVDSDLSRVGAGFKEVGNDASRAGDKIGDAGREGGSKLRTGLTSSLSGLDSDMAGMADKASEKFKGALAVGGAAAGTALFMGMSESFEREAGSDKLAARLDLTAQQSEAFGRAAGNLYANAWGDSVEHVNEALDAVFSSLGDSLGPADNALETTTAKALDLASGFGVDVVQASTVAGVAIRQGLAKDADHAFDLMVSAMQEMPAGMREELFPAIEEYSGFLHNLGFTGEQAFGLLAAASQEGSFGIDKTADALKELTIRATDMSTASVESFEAAGLNAENMAARFLKGGGSAKGALDDLVEGLLEIKDPVARANAAIGLFGTPLEDLGLSEIPQFLKSLTGMESSLGDVAGKAEEFGDTLNDNAATRIESFKRKALDKLVTAIDSHVLPAVEALGGWAKENPTAFKVIAGVIGGVLTVAMLAYAASAAIAAVNTVIAMAPFILIGAVIAGLAALVIIHFDTIKNAIMTAFRWVVDNWPLLLAILTGPIGIAVLLIVKNWNTIKAAGLAVWNWIKSVWPLVVDFLTAPIRRAWFVIRSTWNLIKAGAAAVKNHIVDRFNAIVGFVTGLPGKIRSAASGMWDGIKDAFRSALNFIIRAWNSLSFTLPSVSAFGKKIGGQTISTPNISTLAEGGIVTGPTLAMIGEGGQDEAVVPLPRGMRDLGDGGGPSVVVNVQGSIVSERDIVALIRNEMNRGGFRGSLR